MQAGSNIVHGCSDETIHCVHRKVGRIINLRYVTPKFQDFVGVQSLESIHTQESSTTLLEQGNT